MFLRHLLQSWLHHAAGKKVQEAARQQFSEKAGQDEEEAKPCDLGAVFALAIESGGLEDLLDDATTTRGHGFVVRQGKLRDRQVALIRSGAGRQAAARATEALIEGHRPGLVLSAGFAGGLNSDLKRHDILMVDHVVDPAGEQFSIDLKVDPTSLSQVSGVHVGRLLTVDNVIRLPDEKRSLGRRYNALAVDMETFAVAEVCRRRQVRLLAVRVINDTVDEELPPDVERLLTQKTGPARLGAAAGAAWRRPASIKDMWKLKENALLASDRLARFVTQMIEQL